jgi:hypothetical protein
VNAVDHEKDVDDAFQAGEVKGRNMNIYELRAKPTDGMPHGLNSHGTMKEQMPKKRNSLIAAALEA